MKHIILIITVLICLSLASNIPLQRSKAPDFKNVNAVFNKEFTKFSLDDFKGVWVILLFYPFDFTYVCPTELVAFSEAN